MVCRRSRHHVCAPRSGTTVVLVPVEWQLNVDPSMLRNFQHRVQQVLAGPGPLSPTVPPHPPQCCSRTGCEQKHRGTGTRACIARSPALTISSQPSITSSQGPTQGATTATAAGPSMPPTQVPATLALLTLEQQHIIVVEEIVPTLQNIVATVNLNCRLDLKTIVLHEHNTEYNPKVGTTD